MHNVAAAEAIVLGARAGLDPQRILEVIRSSGAGTSRIFEMRGPMMAKGVYTPPTATMHVLQKDSAIIADFARSLGVDTPMLDAAAPLYDEAAALWATPERMSPPSTPSSPAAPGAAEPQLKGNDPMLSDAQRAAYDRDGVIVVPTCSRPPRLPNCAR